MVIRFISLTSTIQIPLKTTGRVVMAYPFFTGKVAIAGPRRGMAETFTVNYLDEFDRVLGYWEGDSYDSISGANGRACEIMSQYQTI